MKPEARAEVRACLRRNHDDLLAYFERRVHVREDAADLLGETFLQVWRRHESLPVDPTRQRMWLFTIAANLLANHRRSGRRRTALTERLKSQMAVNPGARLDAPEQSAVRDAVLRLHVAHRELVMLIHWDGFTVVEAAEVLGLNPSTARGRYAAARQALREALADAACT
ncbi:sigma-70 family RNA polymerase sigma factor SigL [Nocardioides fonticola]|uniref:Sigma-70 family RNA polymerase sigma factor SigL n=1 Tax=Nocardioides fonticola TaxID=450363 RepID=A0ABP7XIN8_9ACTN